MISVYLDNECVRSDTACFESDTLETSSFDKVRYFKNLSDCILGNRPVILFGLLLLEELVVEVLVANTCGHLPNFLLFEGLLLLTVSNNFALFCNFLL